MKFFGTYVESASYPMLEKENLAVSDTLLPQIAYYATLAANGVEDKDAILKYAPIAIKDKDNGSIAMQLWADALKAKGDTAKWVESLKEGILKFPENQYSLQILLTIIAVLTNQKKQWNLLTVCWLKILITIVSVCEGISLSQYERL